MAPGPCGLKAVFFSLLVFTSIIFGPHRAARAISPSDQDQAMSSFVSEFYYVDRSGRGFFKVDTSGALPDKYHFWQTAEEIEVVEDAYERSHNLVYKKMIGQLIDGLNHLAAANQASNASDWCSWNGYNDDIMWACIALLRAYRDTGHYAYVEQAKAQFDQAWNRPYGWD